MHIVASVVATMQLCICMHIVASVVELHLNWCCQEYCKVFCLFSIKYFHVVGKIRAVCAVLLTISWEIQHTFPLFTFVEFLSLEGILLCIQHIRGYLLILQHVPASNLCIMHINWNHMGKRYEICVCVLIRAGAHTWLSTSLQQSQSLPLFSSSLSWLCCWGRASVTQGYSLVPCLRKPTSLRWRLVSVFSGFCDHRS